MADVQAVWEPSLEYIYFRQDSTYLAFIMKVILKCETYALMNERFVSDMKI